MRIRIVTFLALVPLLSCSDGGVLNPDLPDATRGVAPASLPAVRFSEIHYDNASVDAGEAIEVSGPAGTDLAGYSVVLYNGANGTVYDTDALSGTIPATCGDRGVVVLNYPSNGIQNGAPDGFALVGPDGVIEFLSYEGVFTAVGGPADGMSSTDIGASEAGSEPLGMSLQRTGAGGWSAPAAHSFGICNDGEEPNEIDYVVVEPADATIVAGTTLAFTATAYDAADQPIPGVSFTWSSDDEGVATVDGNGLATGIAPGAAGITATAIGGASDTAELTVVAAGAVFFSEIHYDDASTDEDEKIEIEGPAGTSLAGWSVVLYNGSNGTFYNTANLAGTIPNHCDGRGVVVVSYPVNGIQNGSPDGMALIDGDGLAVEFLSYEGTLVATNGPAAGLGSSDIGVSENGVPEGHSLKRHDDGVWYSAAPGSFGACNGPPPPPPPSTISVFGRTASDPALPVGFQDQLFATLRDPDGNVVPVNFSWSSDTPGTASVDSDGVVTALAEGTMTIRVTADDPDGTTTTFSLPAIVATAGGTADYQDNTEFGVPADGDASDDILVERDQYTGSYNPDRRIPNWVSYQFDATHFGTADRCDCFTFDPELPLPLTRYTTADYTGAGAFHGYGIDRGHLARSFDRTTGSLDNAVTYYFSNIIPQAADNNQGPWAAMETYLGDLARFEDREVYVVTGASGSKGTLKDEGLITIPAQVWKVAVIMPRDQGLDDVDGPSDIEVIAVIMPNDPGVRNVDWNTYRTTVDAVEALSGYDLLANLPDVVEVSVESGIAGALAELDAIEAAGGLNKGNANALTSKLQAAVIQLAAGNTNAAAGQLGAFLNQLDALEGAGRISAADAAALRAWIEPVLAAL